MKHLNKVDENGLVVDCIVVEDDDVSTDEKKNDLLIALNLTGDYVVSDFNYIGGTYNEALGKLIYPQPFPSWALDNNGVWRAPDTGQVLIKGVNYGWLESELQWVEIGQV